MHQLMHRSSTADHGFFGDTLEPHNYLERFGVNLDGWGVGDMSFILSANINSHIFHCPLFTSMPYLQLAATA